MLHAYRLVFYLIGFNLLLIIIAPSTMAQTGNNPGTRFFANSELSFRSFEPDIESLTRPRIKSSVREKSRIDAMLYDAITDRIGLPYRSNGTDDQGYDCSGFVWRVYHDAGVSFRRESARSLWKSLPEADSDEETRFGTLVFFNDLGHVGIVRDAYSFYHVSSTNGVERAFFSGYWEKRIIGFRKIPMPEKLRKIRVRK